MNSSEHCLARAHNGMHELLSLLALEGNELWQLAVHDVPELPQPRVDRPCFAVQHEAAFEGRLACSREVR